MAVMNECEKSAVPLKSGSSKHEDNYFRKKTLKEINLLRFAAK